MSATMLRTVVRWTARIWTVASLSLLSAFIFGDGERGIWPTPMEWLGIAMFPGGVVAGMLIAWWKETLGGAITIASLAGFYAWHFLRAGQFSAGPWFIILAAPGFLFLMASLLERRARLCGS